MYFMLIQGKHQSNPSAPLPDSYDVLNLELQSRIEENEKLHKQVIHFVNKALKSILSIKCFYE